MNTDEFLLYVLIGMIYAITISAVRATTGLITDDLSIVVGYIMGMISLKIVQKANETISGDCDGC